MLPDSADLAASHDGDRCPICRARIVVRTVAETFIRNAILRVESLNGRVTAKCARCKSWVEVPLRFVE